MSSKYKYEYTVFIGRFSPIHKGHLEVIKQALHYSEKLMLFIGSHNRSLSLRYPFDSHFRHHLMRLAFADENIDESRIIVHYINDYMYDDTKWAFEINQLIYENVISNEKVALIGHSKDHTSYYLREFPQFDSIEVPNYKGINSTNIRDHIYMNHDINSLTSITNSMKKELIRWKETNDSKYIINEFNLNNEYKKQWANTPYPVTFTTVDALVTKGNHVLLIERKASPGKGLLALPGGFININETIEESTLRELMEETSIKVPPSVLRGCIVNRKIFDDPHRSSRGRTITTTTHFDLDRSNEIKLPKIKGGDDAANAMWVNIADLDPHKMFEDHYFMICNMLNL